MKKANRVMSVLALLMIVPIVFGAINSAWFVSTEPIIKKDLSDSQIKEICSRLKFEPLPEEIIYIAYSPSAMQATESLSVYVENIKSEADFFSRFKGVAKAGSANIGYTGKYDIEIFKLARTPKDCMCGLSFFDEGESLSAIFAISGYVPELEKIYSCFFYYQNIQPFLKNWTFMVPLAIELILILFLVGQKIRGLSIK